MLGRNYQVRFCRRQIIVVLGCFVVRVALLLIGLAFVLGVVCSY